MSKTNVEFVTELMEFSNSGALAQIIIMHAIENYAKSVCKVTVDELREQWTVPLISPEAWHAACAELLVKMEGRYAKAAG